MAALVHRGGFVLRVVEQFARAWRIHACHARPCVSWNRKPVDIKLLQSQLVGWLVGQEVMMIRCNSIIRGSPPSRRSGPRWLPVCWQKPRSLKVPLNRRKLKIVKVFLPRRENRVAYRIGKRVYLRRFN